MEWDHIPNTHELHARRTRWRSTPKGKLPMSHRRVHPLDSDYFASTPTVRRGGSSWSVKPDIKPEVEDYPHLGRLHVSGASRRAAARRKLHDEAYAMIEKKIKAGKINGR